MAVKILKFSFVIISRPFRNIRQKIIFLFYFSEVKWTLLFHSMAITLSIFTPIRPVVLVKAPHWLKNKMSFINFWANTAWPRLLLLIVSSCFPTLTPNTSKSFRVFTLTVVLRFFRIDCNASSSSFCFCFLRRL